MDALLGPGVCREDHCGDSRELEEAGERGGPLRGQSTTDCAIFMLTSHVIRVPDPPGAVTFARLRLHLKYLFNNSRKLHGI